MLGYGAVVEGAQVLVAGDHAELGGEGGLVVCEGGVSVAVKWQGEKGVGMGRVMQGKAKGNEEGRRAEEEREEEKWKTLTSSGNALTPASLS